MGIRHKAILAVGAAVLAATSGSAAFAGAADVETDFKKFPVENIYRGKPKLPDFAGRDKTYRSLRTRITEGARSGANFAGKWAIVEIGCGAGCLSAFLVDISTGRVSTLPTSGEDYASLTLKYRLDSRLLIARYQSNDACLGETLVWNGTQFQRSAPKRLGPADACYAPI